MKTEKYDDKRKRRKRQRKCEKEERKKKNMITGDEDMKTEKIMIKGKDEKYDERVK